MAGKPQSPWYDPRTPPQIPARASQFDFFSNPAAAAAPHEDTKNVGPRYDVSPLRSYEDDSYLSHSTQYDPHSVSSRAPSATREDPFDSRDDIPLQTQYPNKLADSSNPHLERQDSDTLPLNPQARDARRGRGRDSKAWMWANIPWVTYTLSIIQIGVFISELVKMSQLTGSPIETKPSFNPMIGPSPYLLINMGARYVPCMRNQAGIQDVHAQAFPCPNSTTTTGTCSLTQLCGFEGSYPVPNPEPNMGQSDAQIWSQPAPDQWFRFITPIFLHGGFIHIGGNLSLQLLLGRDMEKIIGSLRFFFVYFSAGIFGFVLGANFAQPGISSTGCSGALFGIVGLVFIDLFYTWPTRKSPWWDLFFLVLTVVIEVVIGLLPTGLDNFSHIGGLAVGLALGVTVLHSPTALRKHYENEPVVNFDSAGRDDRAKRQSRAMLNDDLVHGTQGASGLTIFKDPIGFFKGRKPLWWLWLLFRAACLITVVACFIALLNNFYHTHASNCDWCEYMSCINVNGWCQQGELQQVTTSSAPGPTPAPTSPAALRL